MRVRKARRGTGVAGGSQTRGDSAGVGAVPFGVDDARARKAGKGVADTGFSNLRVPLVTNVDADTIETGEEAREALIRQVTAPVRWEESVRLLIDEGVNTFVEVGPGRVLTGLLRQIERSSLR